MGPNERRGWISGIVLALGASCPSAWAKLDCSLKEEITLEESRVGVCNFDVRTGTFAGEAKQQAACLTKKVKPNGDLGEETITEDFRNLVGTPGPSVDAVQALLDQRKISPDKIGGKLDKPVQAKYFIIHDTSSPNCSEGKACDPPGKFPANLNAPDWRYNKSYLGHPMPAPYRAAHVMTNRVGESIMEADFSDTVVSTKFEQCVDAEVKKTLFIGAENIQPRLHDKRFPKKDGALNDYIAPTPGFTEKQYERLALLYVVASARHGAWLIPIFHGVLDQAYSNGHNDPQNFEMETFSKAVKVYITEMAHASALKVTLTPKP